MPQQLMELMRHESIETTLRFYVGRNAETTAASLWASHEAASVNTFDNNRLKPDSAAPTDSSGGEQQAVDHKDGYDAEEEMRLLGLEPKTYGLKVRCSTN